MKVYRVYEKGKRRKNEEESKKFLWLLCARHSVAYFMDVTSATLENRHYYPYFTGEATDALRGLITKVMQLASESQH